MLHAIQHFVFVDHIVAFINVVTVLSAVAFVAGILFELKEVRLEQTTGYPEGFDQSCGIRADIMREACDVVAHLTGERDLDIRMIARSIELFRRGR